MGLNAQDLKNIASALSALARALADWGNTHPITDPTQQAQFDDFVSSLVQASDSLMNAAVTAALANVAVSAADLQNATDRARHTLKVINDVTTALKIAGAAVALGTSLLSPAPSTVSGALNGLVQAVQPASPAPTGS
jgi:hypothetical protein